MVVAPLAERAGTALVQAMVTDGWWGVRRKVVRLFGQDNKPDAAIEQELDATRGQLASAPPGWLEQTQAKLAAQWQNRFNDVLDRRGEAKTELVALVDELKLVIASAHTIASAGTIADSAWQNQMQNFFVGRYDRVQAAAQTWLTIMTTLFGVFSTVAVIGGPKTITEIHGGLGWRIGVVAGAAAVFVLAFAATMYGLFASWGGLGAGLEPEQNNKPVPHGRPWPWFPVLTVVVSAEVFWQELREMWSPQDLTLAEIADPLWHRYRSEYALKRANRNRRRLHRSRVLGVAAVVVAGLLGFALIANGFIA
jgi:hypothetical protein